MLEAKVRDSKRKGRTLRNAGLVTGTIKRKNGELSLISIIGYKLETHVLRHGLAAEVGLNLEGEIVKTRIYRAQKDALLHNIINIDLIEV